MGISTLDTVAGIDLQTALIAAIVASMGSKINSIATIFTMDVYRPLVADGVSPEHLVVVGRIAAVIALITASVAAQPLLGSFDQGFQFIQEFTGFFTPLQKPQPPSITIELKNLDYSTSAGFNLAAVVIVAVLIVLYATWW